MTTKRCVTRGGRSANELKVRLTQWVQFEFTLVGVPFSGQYLSSRGATGLAKSNGASFWSTYSSGMAPGHSQPPEDHAV